VRIGIVGGSLLALALLLTGQQASQAETATLSPQVVAVVPEQNKLHVTVDLEQVARNQPPDKLRVELLGPGDKVLAKTEAAGQKERPAHFRFDLPATTVAAARLKLVCRWRQHTFTVPVRRVLLARAHETSLSASQEFFAGSTTAIRCAVHRVKSIAETLPLAGARVQVTLQSADGKGKVFSLFSGQTRKDGTAEARFQVPQVPTGQYSLVVTTQSALGEEKLERKVQVKSEAKILLVSDKPLYQPGQMMHLRALALRPFDLKPVGGAEIVFEVEDAKGNKVFKRAHKTSPYGIAFEEFQLADEVNEGAYQVRAILGQQQAQKTVTVKPYVLPKFKVNVTSDKRYYLPKETVKAEVQTDYFFGKPVAGGKVKVTASTFDVQFRTFQTWEGKTDASGHVKFEIKLPDYFVGQPLQKGDALVRFEVKVTDTADHTETINRSWTVSDQPIRVSLIPEGGRLVPGMANRVFAAALYPDGTPAACSVKLWQGKEAKGKPVAEIKTNEAGLAEFSVTPKSEQFRPGPAGMRTVEMLGGVSPQIWGQQLLFDLCAEARDRKGTVARSVAELNAEPFGENVLLRLDKAIYQGGETLAAEVRTSAGLPTVYLDVIKGGQTLLTRWLDVKDGKAEHRLDLPQNVFGTLEIHAYQILRSGEIIRDSRVVYVQPKNDLKIEVKADKEVHQPGENGRIHFQVTDAQGKPAVAALGVIIVDEAVYALQEMQPGLEKVYFTLQEELLKPQVQVAYKPHENIAGLVRQPVLPAGKQQVAQALLAAVRPKAPPRWEVAPEVARQQRMENQVQQVGWALHNYATQHRPFQEFDKKTGAWQFRTNLLGEMIQAHFLNDAMLTDPLGGKLTLERLAKMEKNFTVERLAQAVNAVRMYQLVWAFIRYSNANQNQLLKDGKWSFPATVLADTVKGGGLNNQWLTDVWGTPYKLVKVAKKQANAMGYSQLDYHQLVSAGPDRKFGTKDDVTWNNPNHNIWYYAQWWWTAEGSRLAQHNMNFGMRGRGLARRQLMEQFRFERGAALRDGMMPRAAQLGAVEKKAGNGRPLLAPMAKGEGMGGGGGGAAGPPVRVREYFPETLRWDPAVITDERGRATVALTYADSITTWRLSASASSQGGALGGVSAPLRVFQDFFVDLDLPVHLTQNDEVAFPVAVYNYLKTPQTVQLELQKEPWFELTDAGGFTRSLDLKPNEVTSVKFRIKARKIGFQPLLVKARGSKLSDAIKRTIEVVPDGKRIEQVITDRLAGKVTQTIAIPEHALPEASRLMVKIYPGVVSQVLEGAEGMIRLPGG
jgi:hypothetical protein